MGNTRRTSVLIATTCALVASPVMGPASAAPTPLRTGHFAHVRVHDAHGRPVPGATVVLLQEPAAATLANLRVGDSYSAVAVASGQTSELGVGVSATGAYGSFSVGGTSAQSSGISINYPTLSATFQQYLKTQWLYGKFKDVYTTCVKGFCTSTTSYGARPYKFIGGSLLNTASSVPSATHCAYYISGSGATVSTGSAITWTNGVSIGSVIGIDLSSKTGYAVNAELKYTFTANRHLCGTGDYPNGANSYQIVAEA